MKMVFHSALLVFYDAILPHWQSWTGNLYGNQTFPRKGQHERSAAAEVHGQFQR
jgi:hypothetical protein